MSIIDQLNEIELKIRTIEERFSHMDYDTKSLVQSSISDRFRFQSASESMYGMYTALVVETIDIWKQNRIRFFCPLYSDPKAPTKELPWAYPISAMGGFDDSGLSWIPPAGSTVCLLFENGARDSAYYIGTTWHRNRGTGLKNWGINIEEYQRVSEGHRKGYLVGPNDESQVLPPWNTESYNGFDLNSVVDFAENPEAQKRITYPNIYGFKTPETHMIKMVDGDPKCNRRWKRMEIMSGCGNWIMLKDDHLHYSGQWSHPSCGVKDADVSCIVGQDEGNPSEDITKFQGLTIRDDDEAKRAASARTENIAPKDAPKKEKTECEGKLSNSKIIGGHPSTGHPSTKYFERQKGANPYFKHENECRPYKGPGTPQNNKADLPQSGIQILSISGHSFVMDDSVEEPRGNPEWERSMESFDFGCNNHYVGHTYWKSATGHMIEMSDVEEPPGQEDSMLRGENNYIKLLSAAGNRVELNDETVYSPNCPGCPPNIAGPNRGITLHSTSNHKIEMIDDTNEQCSPCRKDGGKPVPKAKKAFIKIRTGYGLEILMKDENSQQETVHQHIQIFCPQKDNKKRGPHIERFQEKPSGPGLIFLRAGGNYVISTYDNKFDLIGSEENPSDYMEIISRKKLIYTKDVYLNISEKLQLFLTKERILLMAGEGFGGKGDCGEGECKHPCVGPVLVYVGGCVRLSDRVFGSSSMDAPPASIFMLAPFAQCAEPNCS